MMNKYVNIKCLMDIPFRKTKKGISFRVKVEPRSSRQGISGLIGDALKVKVHAPPVGGAANDELIEILAAEFQVKKPSIKIARGHSSRDKIIEIKGIGSIPRLYLKDGERHGERRSINA
jgi:uncharacterized protein (TIGR00251 family)